MIRTWIGIFLIVVGVIFEVFSVVGIYRFKYVLNRMHSAAMGDTMAILFVMLGLIVLEGFTFTSLKLAAIIVFFWLASPVSSHLICNLVSKVDEERLKNSCEIIDDKFKPDEK